jgi:hypothetical protein
MRRIGIIFFIVLLAGCESIVNFPEINDAAQYPVIEALLTDKAEIQKVRVSYTARLDDTLNSIPVNNARVRIFSNTGDTFLYQNTGKGWYESKPFAASSGKVYTLKVEVDTISVQASGSLISMNGIDSLYIKPSNNSTSYSLFANAGSADPASTRYYQLNISRNDTLLTGDSNIAVFNDQYLTSLHTLRLPYFYSLNDTVDIELFSISKPMYDYFLAISINIFNLNFINSGYQTNLPQMFGKSVLGYFQVSAVNRERIIIRP